MGAQLKGTVYVTDPDTHQTVELAPGTCPEPRLAALVTNPSAWVNGELPHLEPKIEGDPPKGPQSPADPASDPDGASGADPGAAENKPTDTQPDIQAAADVDTKPAASKTAAKKPARGRTAAVEGAGGQ